MGAKYHNAYMYTIGLKGLILNITWHQPIFAAITNDLRITIKVWIDSAGGFAEQSWCNLIVQMCQTVFSPKLNRVVSLKTEFMLHISLSNEGDELHKKMI